MLFKTLDEHYSRCRARDPRPASLRGAGDPRLPDDARRAGLRGVDRGERGGLGLAASPASRSSASASLPGSPLPSPPQATNDSRRDRRPCRRGRRRTGPAPAAPAWRRPTGRARPPCRRRRTWIRKATGEPPIAAGAASAEIRIFVVHHQHAVADPDLGMADAAGRLDQSELLHRAESLHVELDRRLGVVHRHVRLAAVWPISVFAVMASPVLYYVTYRNVNRCPVKALLSPPVRGRPRDPRTRAAILSAARSPARTRRPDRRHHRGDCPEGRRQPPHDLSLLAERARGGDGCVPGDDGRRRRRASHRRTPLAALRAQLHALADAFAAPAGRSVAAMVAAAQSETELAKAFRNEFIARNRDATRALLERCIADKSIAAARGHGGHARPRVRPALLPPVGWGTRRSRVASSISFWTPSSAHAAEHGSRSLPPSSSPARRPASRVPGSAPARSTAA